MPAISRRFARPTLNRSTPPRRGGAVDDVGDRLEQADEGGGRHRLAAAGFAEQRQGFAAAGREADLVDGADRAGEGADVDAQAVDLEHGLGVGLADGGLVVYGCGHDVLSDPLRGLGEAGQALLRDGEAPPLAGIGGDAGPGREDGRRDGGDHDGQAGEERQPPRGVQVGAALRRPSGPS